MADQDKQIENIPIQKLIFDSENPRLPTHVDASDVNEVLKWMLRDATLVELMGSIGEKGYFPGEPVLVLKPKDRGGEYTVVEGNRRLAAVMLLNQPELAPVRASKVRGISEQAKERPSELPAIIYTERAEILDYLGYRHITGIKEWEPLAKAKYLKRLFDQSQARTDLEKFSELAKTIGSRAHYVGRLLAGLAAFRRIQEEDFYDIDGLEEGALDFSLLTTALSYESIVVFLGLNSAQDQELSGLDSKNLEKMTRWMYEKVNGGKSRLGESRNLRMLSKVVEHEEALRAFEESKWTLADAAQLTDLPMEIFRSSIAEAKSNLEAGRG